MKTIGKSSLLGVLTLVLVTAIASTTDAQEVLPFPPTPSASTAGLTMKDSIYKKRVDPKHLPADAPNILIILMDDVGPGQASTYGGEVNTPTLTRVAQMGISYNAFHSTAMLFLVESAKNENQPIGGGLWTPVLHPEDAPTTPYTEWTFSGPITGMPEFTAPKLGKFNNTVSMEVEVPANANGVLYALGGFSGGLSLYVVDSELRYEYNLFEIDRTHIKATVAKPGLDRLVSGADNSLSSASHMPTLSMKCASSSVHCLSHVSGPRHVNFCNTEVSR